VFWKILGIVVAVWIAFVVVGAIVGAVLKLLIPALVLGILVALGYGAYKAISGSNSNDITRF
jgi:hypothetical protein